ncbi:hypothetical protein [Streptomyces sp. CRN 30]|uniref:hypothetical protein n=1 Tax=Streptomyces sp. CRN 30 TaxID=3075613 RepID=UPI002A82B0C1|nr:hypothetical protein [Streptomyces sp. CRN 30]
MTASSSPRRDIDRVAAGPAARPHPPHRTLDPKADAEYPHPGQGHAERRRDGVRHAPSPLTEGQQGALGAAVNALEASPRRLRRTAR